MLTRKDLYKYIEIKEALADLPAQADAFAKEFISYTVNVISKALAVEMAKIEGIMQPLGDYDDAETSKKIDAGNHSDGRYC